VEGLRGDLLVSAVGRCQNVRGVQDATAAIVAVDVYDRDLVWVLLDCGVFATHDSGSEGNTVGAWKMQIRLDNIGQSFGEIFVFMWRPTPVQLDSDLVQNFLIEFILDQNIHNFDKYFAKLSRISCHFCRILEMLKMAAQINYVRVYLSIT
jgi:hypothetical protein